MFGNWRWNLFFGLFGMLLIMLISLIYNPLITSIIRGTYAFIAFFVIAFPVRFVGGMILSTQTQQSEQERSEEGVSGANVNLSTPDETNALNDLLKTQLNGDNSKSDAAAVINKEEAENSSNSFEPLKPPQLVSTTKLQTEEMTKAIRHLTGE